MASYEQPYYLKNNQFIPEFNSLNFSEPNSTLATDFSIAQLDDKYLSKTKNDSSNYNLSVNQLTAQTSIITPSINFGGANNLNYYEEGTFEATFVNPLTSGNGTYSDSFSYYTRIGRVIYFTVFFKYNKGGGNTYSSNNVEIQLGSLSKPVSTRNSYAVGYSSGFVPQVGDKYQIVFSQSNNQNVFVWKFSGSTPSSIKYDDFPAGTLECQFSGFYFI